MIYRVFFTGSIIMKFKNIMKSCLSLCVMLVAYCSVNTACTLLVYQDELPEGVQRMREAKFK